jgi:diacylglycerol kinase (ATP)
MSKFLVIANPAAGRGQPVGLAEWVCRCLRERGAHAELKCTTARGEAQRLARQACEAGVDVVVGAGGDGTLREIASALEGTPVAVGMIPCGRCNDLARACGFSGRESPEELAGILVRGHRQRIDLGTVGGERFLTVATFGFASAVSRFVELRPLPVRGKLAYLYAILRVLMSYRPGPVRLRGESGAREGCYLMAMVANSPYFAGGIPIAPGACPDDNRLRVCLVKNVSRLSLLAALRLVPTGAHLEHPAVEVWDTPFLEFETPQGPEWICADGESLVQTPCRFEVRPRALEVVTAGGRGPLGGLERHHFVWKSAGIGKLFTVAARGMGAGGDDDGGMVKKG